MSICSERGSSCAAHPRVRLARPRHVKGSLKTHQRDRPSPDDGRAQTDSQRPARFPTPTPRPPRSLRGPCHATHTGPTHRHAGRRRAWSGGDGGVGGRKQQPAVGRRSTAVQRTMAAEGDGGREGAMAAGRTTRGRPFERGLPPSQFFPIPTFTRTCGCESEVFRVNYWDDDDPDSPRRTCHRYPCKYSRITTPWDGYLMRTPISSARKHAKGVSSTTPSADWSPLHPTLTRMPGCRASMA